MKLPDPLYSGTLIRRYKRFLVAPERIFLTRRLPICLEGAA